jgi:hypothetical protein
MQNTPSMEAAKLALFEKLLRGEVNAIPNKIPRLARRPASAPAPLSYNQEQVYLHAQLADRLAPRSRLYNETITIHRSGSLDVQALELSLAEILRRHEAWRTKFASMNGIPVQSVHAVPDAYLDVVDLSRIPESKRELATSEIAEVNAQEPFDLAEGPLVRFQLVRLNDWEHRLFLTAHQIVLDGVSAYHVFLTELVALYEAFASGKSSPLPEPPVQYSDYAQWQRDTLKNGSLSEHLNYWQRQLAGGVPVLRLPTDHPRPQLQTFRGTIQSFAISRKVSNAVKALTRAEGTTLFVTFLAVFATLLYSYTGQEEIVIGTVAPTRDRSELRHLLGYFLNPVVLYFRLAGNPTFKEVLIRVRDVVLGALSHDQIPFHLLVDAIQPESDLSRHPLFQVQFSLEPPISPPAPAWNLTPMDLQTGGAKLDLYFVLDDRPDGTFGRAQYNPDLFQAATIHRMIRTYQAFLDEAAADPNKRLSELLQQ